MDKLIAVVDLTSGKLLERAEETLTLDIPPDFDSETGGVFVDAERLGRYRTAKGESRVYITVPRPLSRRRAGEECLVAAQEVDPSSGSTALRRYWRSVVKPTH
jgi:hypothetical protein